MPIFPKYKLIVNVKSIYPKLILYIDIQIECFAYLHGTSLPIKKEPERSAPFTFRSIMWIALLIKGISSILIADLCKENTITSPYRIGEKRMEAVPP
jgi:hypothetical protein